MTDPYVWLEQVQSEDALNWVEAQNRITLETLESDVNYKAIEDDLRPILFANDRLLLGGRIGDYFYNFWQDRKSTRGLWRRTRLSTYDSQKPEWDILLDLDALAEKEEENWVWAGASCSRDLPDRCLIYLSRGGKDAFVMREYDLVKKKFVENGFELPEAKSRISWLNGDQLLIGTDWGPDSLTTSGYPRSIRSWTRGSDWKQATEIFTGKSTDVSATTYQLRHRQESVQIISRSYSFFESEKFMLDRKGRLQKLDIPETASIEGLYEGFILVTLRDPLNVSEQTFAGGALVAFPVTTGSPELVYAPEFDETVRSVAISSDRIMVNLLKNVMSRTLLFHLEGNKWQQADLDLPEAVDFKVISVDPNETGFLAVMESFLEPASLYFVDTRSSGNPFKLIQSGIHRFDSSRFVTEQHWAKSKDGTLIPYFLVAKRGITYQGKNPTLLYGYGGFRVSLTPSYLSTTGKAWLEKGGVYVVANIRGGGEFGPDWHRQALKKNRQRAYDDFIAVAEDLITSNVTSPEHLGIYGGSNGGLLVGAVTMQRPELFGAVICAVPLLDMLRYHLLLAGASWMAEYGDPDDPEIAKVIRQYSPYQNIRTDREYPEIFFMTSTLDDRVHPGHARKMAAKLKETGASFLYYENTEGGHGGAANLEQQLKMQTLRFTYLLRKLHK